MSKDFSNDREDEDESFSDDPQEQLRFENELLRLKLQAETGADLSNISGNIPPEVEHAFLSNILAFERQLDNVEEVTIFEMVGKPEVKPEALLSDEEIAGELEKLLKLMEEKGVAVSFEGDYDARLKYKFVTEELFEKSTHKFDIEGMINHFSYEEYHPNHKLDIENTVYGFLEMWMERNVEALEHSLASTWTLKDETCDKAAILARFSNIFDAYTFFKNDSFTIQNLTLNDAENATSAIVTGDISYDAEMDNYERVKMEGDFVFKLVYEENSWLIANLRLPAIDLL